MAEKVKTTIYVDKDVMRDVRVAAARDGRPVSELIEDALRTSTRSTAIDRIRAHFDLDPEEAERIAVEEVRAHRREQASR